MCGVWQQQNRYKQPNHMIFLLFSKNSKVRDKIFIRTVYKSTLSVFDKIYAKRHGGGSVRRERDGDCGLCGFWGIEKELIIFPFGIKYGFFRRVNQIRFGMFFSSFFLSPFIPCSGPEMEFRE